VNPEKYRYSIKRLMGRNTANPSGVNCVEEDARRKTYKVKPGPNNEVRVVMGGKEYSPPEISAMICRS